MLLTIAGCYWRALAGWSIGQKVWLTCLSESDLQCSIGSIGSCQHVVHLMQLCLATNQLCALAGKLTRHLHHAADHPPDCAVDHPSVHEAHCPADRTAYRRTIVHVFMQVIMQASRTNCVRTFMSWQLWRHSTSEEILVGWRRKHLSEANLPVLLLPESSTKSMYSNANTHHVHGC